tara:strand:+ start:639 stop:890 length:252 start_codon:yes stop_codon:yes gene_type:complete
MTIYKVNNTYYAFKSDAINECDKYDRHLISKWREELSHKKSAEQVKLLQKSPTRNRAIKKIELHSTTKSNIVNLLNNEITKKV